MRISLNLNKASYTKLQKREVSDLSCVQNLSSTLEQLRLHSRLLPKKMNIVMGVAGLIAQSGFYIRFAERLRALLLLSFSIDLVLNLGETGVYEILVDLFLLPLYIT